MLAELIGVSHCSKQGIKKLRIELGGKTLLEIDAMVATTSRLG